MLVNERSSFRVNIALVDQDGDPITPTAVSYTLTDSSGEVIVSTTSLPAASTVTIHVTSEQNRILRSTNELESRTITVSADYSAGTETATYSWDLLNLRWVDPAEAPTDGWNELEQITLDLIGEDSENPDVFSAGDPQIRDSVNVAIQELAFATGSYERSWHLVQLADRQLYRVVSTKGDHFVSVSELYDRQTHRKLWKTSLRSLAAQDPWFMKRSGTPTHYFVVGADLVGLYPIPTSSGSVLEGRVLLAPRAYTSHIDPILLRPAFSRAAPLLAASEFYASRGDAKRAGEYFAEYIEVAKLKAFQPEEPHGRVQ